MPKVTYLQTRRFPLHVHICALFTLLLLLVCVALGFLNYHQTSQMIASSTERLFDRIQHDVQKDLNNTYQPIRHLLSLLSLDSATQSIDLESRLALLPSFSQALRDNPMLNSLYLGYHNGDFFMVRPLNDDTTKKRFEAPPTAAYQVWSIRRNNQRVQAEYLFFDDDLNEISRLERPDEKYDPRERRWFKQASIEDTQITTEPYVFFSTDEIGTTLARRSGNTAVLAADLTLAALSETLATHQVTPNSELILVDTRSNVVAYPDVPRLVNVNGNNKTLVKARDINPLLGELLDKYFNHQAQDTVVLDNRRWVTAQRHIQEGGPQGLHLALLIPEKELLADAYQTRFQGALITLATLLLALSLCWLASHHIAKSLRELVAEAETIIRFDFSRLSSGRSHILEVDQLAVSMRQMKETLGRFLDIAASLSAETNFDSLLRRVLDSTVTISGAQGGLIYLYDTDSGHLNPKGFVLDGQTHAPEDLGIKALALSDDALPDWLRDVIDSKASVAIPMDLSKSRGLHTLLSIIGNPQVQLIATSLRNRQQEAVGILVLFQRDDKGKSECMLTPERVAFVEAVSGSAALCIDSQRLLAKQKQLLDAFIQLIAGAIDAKSPYTGGHCQRVPEITMMLARAAADSDAPEFSSYHPNEEEWEALYIASWLHDCGKVTTPEYVVDKATKLETIYDRIHEVRMRFEVLKRDAWILYWKNLAEGGNEAQQTRLRDAELNALDEEFTFIARTNRGGEAMTAADQARLGQIAKRRWLRTLDNSLGVSWEEEQRMRQHPNPALPVEEFLLDDRPEHLIERPEQELIAPDNPWGFKLNVPEHKFNRGELYNLSICSGTLNKEERYVINHHMVQTIIMLSHLPFPKHLQCVTEIAGGHHEKMDGTGYPKRLTHEQMSLPARIMAIADIFEALTAADRPYKKGKTLSEAINIMTSMCEKSHIDPNLFSLFIRSSIYKQYAQRFMQPELIDEVDERSTLERVSLSKQAKELPRNESLP